MSKVTQLIESQSQNSKPGQHDSRTQTLPTTPVTWGKKNDKTKICANVHRKIYLVKLLKKNSFKKSRLKYKLKENISFQS